MSQSQNHAKNLINCPSVPGPSISEASICEERTMNVLNKASIYQSACRTRMASQLEAAQEKFESLAHRRPQRLARLGMMTLFVWALHTPPIAEAQTDAKQCATSISEAERSPSALLNKVAGMVRGRAFTNRSQGTHITFGSNQFHFQLLSTDNSGRLVRQTGLARLCQHGESLILSTPDGRELAISPQGNCFQISPGGIANALMSMDMRTFCPGEMPRVVSSACAREAQCAVANRLNPAGDTASPPRQSVAAQSPQGQTVSTPR